MSDEKRSRLVNEQSVDTSVSEHDRTVAHLTVTPPLDRVQIESCREDRRFVCKKPPTLPRPLHRSS